MAIVTKTYSTVAQANTVLGETTPWDDSEAAEKLTALEWATVYMDDTYNIPSNEASNQTLINANALLGNSQLTASLFKAADSAAPAKGLKKSKVKADVVESETEYDPYITGSWNDPYPDVSAMMINAGYALKKSGGMQTAILVRR